MAQELNAFDTKPDHLSWLLRTHLPEGEPICVICSHDHMHASHPETNINKDKSMSSVTGQLCTGYANILTGHLKWPGLVRGSFESFPDNFDQQSSCLEFCRPQSSLQISDPQLMPPPKKRVPLFIQSHTY